MKSPKNAAIVLLALATVGGAVVIWKQHLELVQLRAAAMTNDERADWQKRLWAAEKRAKELADELAALKGQQHANGDEMAADDSGNQDNNQNRRGRRGQNGNAQGFRGPGGALATLLDQPQMQKLVAMQQKAALDTRYAALFKNLNLSPEQLEKFKSLLVERQTAIQDVLAAARAEGINPGDDRDAFRKMIASTQGEIDNSIKSLLGDDSYAKYQNYQETMGQRNTVNQLQQSLSYTNSPLTDTQAEQLVQILAQNSSRNGANRGQTNADGNVTFEVTAAPDNGGGGGRGGNNFGRGGGTFVNVGFGGPGGGGTQITNEAIAASQGVLSGQQVQALQQLQAQQQAQQQLQQSIRQTMETQRGNGGNNGNRNGGTGSGNANTGTSGSGTAAPAPRGG